jgi:rod shape determining protein RodA
MAILERPAAPPGLDDRKRRGGDRILVAAIVALSGLGLLMIYSATRVSLQGSDLPDSVTMERQLIFVTAGLLVLYGLSRYDYRNLRDLLPFLYGVVLVLLLAVFAFDPIKGARRWIPLPFFNLQPAEFTKIVIILGLAVLLIPGPEEDGSRLSWAKVGKALVLVGVPAALIFVQPDLGTMLAIPFVLLVMLFAAGANWRQLALLAGSAVAAAVAVVSLGMLESYQLDRIRVLFDPDIDPQGIGWNLRQSKLAIGSGQLFGKGLFEGTQTNLQFVPEQENDFIFTALGEQLGFAGGIVALFLYAVIVWRLLVIAANARDRFGALVAAGLAGLLVFHVFVNIGMTVGIAPVTGLPLPFMSQGGSFYLSMMAGMAIANSIWIRRARRPGEA